MTMVTEKTVSPETEVAPNKRGSTVKYCCGACGILFVLIVGGIVAMFLFAERSCTTNFKIPDIFKPSPQAPVPPGGTFPEDFSNLPEYSIIDQYPGNMNVAVDPDVKDDDLKKLNSYLSQTYFPGMSVFNISYFSADDKSELIAVYNYNNFTGTDNFTILPPEPGARYPAGQ